MHKSLKTFLLFLGAVQLCPATPGGSKKAKQATVEDEKIRLAYLGLHPDRQIVPTRHPRIPLPWKSLPKVSNVTEQQIKQAQDAYDALQQQIDALAAKRNAYLEAKSPAYKELESLSKHIMEFLKKHQQEFMDIMKDCPYNKEFFKAETDLAHAWFKLDQLNFIYEIEHQKLYHGPWGSFTFKHTLSLNEVRELAKKAPTIRLAPGSVLTDTTSPALPALAIPSGSVYSRVNTAVESYLLHELPAKKNLKCKRGMEFSLEMTYKSSPTENRSMVGESTGANYYTFKVGKDACPGKKTCIIQKHVNGEYSVLFTVEVVHPEERMETRTDRQDKTRKK